MKKGFAILLVMLILSTVFSSCSSQSAYDEGYADGYDDGYSDGEFDMQLEVEDSILAGYDTGYYDGIAEAQHDIAVRVEDDLSSIAWDISDKYGLFPDEALQILSNYADVPDEVDKEELNDAIWAICRYYYDSNEIINNIDDYWID